MYLSMWTRKSVAENLTSSGTYSLQISFALSLSEPSASTPPPATAHSPTKFTTPTNTPATSFAQPTFFHALVVVIAETFESVRCNFVEARFGSLRRTGFNVG